uniref:Regulator of telomere elongation helicase 1 n=1 Tax=Sparus aurata TaxID=8175 RepID=A0A671VTF0_SPAAU
MSSLTLNGVTVNFPFTPYDCQKDYMSKVIECLQTKSNGVLESPTGTGKTLCLLCSTLAWREHFKDTISARKIAERLGSEEMFPNTPLSSWGTAATDGDTPTYYTDVPKIIYASRTHSQLAQVINELKNTSYRPKVCVLGSREQLCINQEVMRQESNHIKVHMCRSKVSTRSCVFYNNYEEKSTDKDLVNSILDVEDLVKFGNKQRACPYYLSRSLKQQADIIFMPYNYLLDPKSRRAHNIELNGAVIIFDEAHNVEKTCEESTSFDLTPYDIASAIDAVNRLLVEQAKDVSCGDSVSGDFNVDSLNSGQNEILLNLEAAIDSYDVPSDKGITKPGSFIYELLERAQLTYSSKTAVCEALEQIIGYLSGRQYGLVSYSFLYNMLLDLGYLTCSVVHYVMYLWHRESHFPSFLLNLVNWSLYISLHPVGNILSYWCFSPGFSMQDLVSQGVRCIILTSGTLSPLSSFTSEMRIEFKVSLENSHVIDRDQIFVSVIDRGPDGVHLSSAFDRRFVPENMASLANLSRVVPHGLLVFFPSFPLMEKTLEFWRAKGHADRIETVKPIFVEPKGKGTFTEVMDGYYSKVNDPASKGGTFFAVCRGKASEGLDFANTFGRGVIITGLPFPPRMDPRVILKMQFLDEMIRKNTSKLKYLSGQQWYKQQAFRAVNQAIGRVIRHREDYGAIFLCDQRFKNSDARAQLPSWVRPYVRLYDGFGNVVRDVSQFFRVAQKMVGSILMINCSMNHCPAVITKKQTVLCRQKPPNIGPDSESCDTLSLPDTRSSGFASCSYSQSSNTQKANRLSTLSLQHDKRMDDEMRGGKRKIRLVQEQDSRAKTFLAEMKKSLSQVTFECIVQALQTYKKSDNLDALLTKTTVLSEDANTHSLLRGLYQFVRAHHKQRFDEKCQELTGQGCGYKPDHSLTKDKKTALKLGTSNCTQLNTQQLNKGGPHLNHTVLSCYSGSAPKSEVHAAFLADVKKALGAEKSAQLFQAIYSYKKTDNYENLVTTVVSLFTERDEDFNLLVRFGVFIRPHHKKQYKDMLDSLVGQSDSAADVPALSEDLQRHGKDNAMHSIIV